MITEETASQHVELNETALPTAAVVQLPLWAAKIALRIAGLKRNASHSIIIVIDEEEVRYSVDSVPFERVRVGQRQ